ncbi:hypothetical protein ABG768_012013, partial [Culter alburnus]
MIQQCDLDTTAKASYRSLCNASWAASPRPPPGLLQLSSEISYQINADRGSEAPEPRPLR